MNPLSTILLRFTLFAGGDSEKPSFENLPRLIRIYSANPYEQCPFREAARILDVGSRIRLRQGFLCTQRNPRTALLITESRNNIQSCKLSMIFWGGFVVSKSRICFAVKASKIVSLLIETNSCNPFFIPPTKRNS